MTRLLGIFAAAIVALGLTAPKAEAVVIYDWTGTCTGNCTGQATAVLTLADSYVPGTVQTTADFISFSYSSSSGAYHIPDDAAFLVLTVTGNGALPAVSGEGDVVLDFAGVFGIGFFSPNASWSSRFPSNGIMVDTMVDGGSASTWTLRQPTELSAPGPLPLLALGLAGLALAGRRRKQS